jgi:predicted O-methyltransferase YrrM
MSGRRPQHPNFPAHSRPALFLSTDTRSLPARAAAVARQLAAFVRLPPRSAVFYLRALARAWRAGDGSSATQAARPVELLPVHRAAGDAREVVEIGTGRGWTAISLALARRDRHVTTVDSVPYPEMGLYLELVSPADRARLDFVTGHGQDGPHLDRPIDFLFIDSSHLLEETMSTFRAWSELVRPGGSVAFHDYRNPHFPDVERAVEELGLHGEVHGQVFLWRKPANTVH